MIIIGLDPHPNSHTAAALDKNGRTLSNLTINNDEVGFSKLKGWAEGFDMRTWAVEGAGNHFIAPWVAELLTEGERVVNIPPSYTSQYRSRRGRKKNDVIDAENAARVLLANPQLPDYTPSAVQQALKELSRTRRRLAQQLSANRMALAALQNGTGAQRALHEVVDVLRAEVHALDREIEEAVKALLPELLELKGVGTRLGGVILAEAGDKHFADEAHFASYCGAAPVSRSSGKRQRAQVNPGGNRRLNWALHMIALTRLRLDPRSQQLFARKQQEGHTERDAFRVLKTYIARELYRFLKSIPRSSCLLAT